MLNSVSCRSAVVSSSLAVDLDYFFDTLHEGDHDMKFRASYVRLAFPQACANVTFLEDSDSASNHPCVATLQEIRELLDDHERLTEDLKQMTALAESYAQEAKDWREHAQQIYDRHDGTDLYRQ